MADIRSRLSACLAGLAALVLSGCASVFPPTGVILSQYAGEHVVPYAQATTDTQMAVCGTGLGTSHLIGSFSRVSFDPHYLMFYNAQLAAYCSEASAHDASLRYLRARNQGQIAEATDALNEEKNWHALTARRRFESYSHMVQAYEDPGQGECPFFWYDDDELAFMLGLVTGMQAVRSDMLSGAQVGVPRNLAVHAAAGANCLDNTKWWGVPDAIRATVWAYVPGTQPEDADIWETYRSAAEVAGQSGMRLALALYATGADNRGNVEELKNAIRLAAEIGKKTAPPQANKLVDAISMDVVQYFSDKIWTEEAGHRTPVGALGTFPNEGGSADIDTEGLL